MKKNGFIVLDTNVLGLALKSEGFLLKAEKEGLIVLIPQEVIIEKIVPNDEGVLTHCGAKDILDFIKKSKGRVQFLQGTHFMIEKELRQRGAISNQDLVVSEEEFQETCRALDYIRLCYEEKKPISREFIEKRKEFLERNDFLYDIDITLRSWMLKEGRATKEDLDSLDSIDVISGSSFIGEKIFDNKEGKPWKEWHILFESEPLKFRTCYGTLFLLQKLVYSAAQKPSNTNKNPNSPKKNNWVDRMIFVQSLYSDFFLTDEKDLIEVGKNFVTKLGLDLEVMKFEEFVKE